MNAPSSNTLLRAFALASMVVSTSGCGVMLDIVDAGAGLATLFFGGFTVLGAGVLALAARG